MTRLLRPALLLSTLLLLPVLLIRAQPYDNRELRAFLTPPPDCPAPCFMGIRPGVTTAGEAIAILEEHPWVLWGNESQQFIDSDFVIRWGWSKAALSWINHDGSGWVLLYMVDTST